MRTRLIVLIAVALDGIYYSMINGRIRATREYYRFSELENRTSYRLL